MATILKIEDSDNCSQLDVHSFNEDQLIAFWVKDGSEHYINVNLDKQEVEELIDYLQKLLKLIK
ncbi:MAG: hypothetical protein ACK5LF_24160 [Bacteroides xylanisolvens]